jgi:GNAT superfamily N-acetyltransferase
MPNYIRRLQDSDHADAMRLAAAFHAESAYARFPLALAKVDELIQKALANDDMACFVLASPVDDSIHGYLMAICHEHYFSYSKTVSDLGFYIEPMHRDLFAARSMLQAIERWAFHVKHAADISLGISSGIADQAIERFYRRMGYQRGYSGMIKSR